MSDSFPTLVLRPSPAARAALGTRVRLAARRALRAMLDARAAEVAFIQIRVDGAPYAISSRRGARGDLIIEIDLGADSLEGRVVTEAALRRAATRTRVGRRSGT
jgi:hypothetical protein